PEPEPHPRESSTTPQSHAHLTKIFTGSFLHSLPIHIQLCHIYFSPPTNAMITPCGHVACGPCLFTAVKTALRRETMMMGGAIRDEGGSRCVCWFL
ncbi:hypothetical protein F5890DRAFT_1547498, partial [Lentinula detonsa]